MPRHAVGPALLWSPFYAGAHGYVVANRALGRLTYEANGYSPPYVRSTAVGTIAVAVAGAWLLIGGLRRRWGLTASAIAVSGSALASSTAYDLLVQSTMAHGVCFGVACVLVRAWLRAEEDPSLRSWLLLGASFGMLMLVRWQTAVYALLVGPLAVAGLWRRTLDWRAVASGTSAAIACFSPQMVVCVRHFGTPLTNPHGSHFVDWSSPFFVDTLISADRGLFTWTPVALLGFCGLVASLRSQPLFAAPALLVIAANACVNGGLDTWAGAHSFAARRFVLVVPLIAAGLAAVVCGLRSFVARRPLAVPAAMVAGLVAWNFGLIVLFQNAVFYSAAPMERLAAAQARLFRHVVEESLGAIGGPRARGLAYKALVGEYFWHNVKPGGRISVGGEDDEYLVSGWSSPHCRAGWPRFRWALHPEACVRFPLDEAFDLRTSLLVRSRSRLERQAVAVVANGRMAAVERG